MSKRLTLLAILAAAILPVLIFAAVMVARLDRHQQDAVETTLRQTARSAIRVIDHELKGHMATLAALATSPLLDEGASPAFQVHAGRVLDEQPDWLTVRLVDAPSRRTLVDLLAPAGADLPGTPDPMGVDAVIRSGEPRISGIIRDDAGGEPFVVLRVPVLRDGAVRYTLSAAVRAAAFSEILREQPIPQGWTLAVLDRDYTITGRTRAEAEFIGTRATPSLTDEIDRATENFFFALNKEGDRVYSAFSQSPASGWTVAVGAPGAVVEQPLRRSLLVSIGSGGAALALALLLGGGLLRNATRRREVEQQLEAERATEQRLSNVAANFPGAIYRRVLHPDGRISYPYVGGRVRLITGMEPGPNGRGASLEDAAAHLIGPEHRSGWREAIETSARALSPYSIEMRVQPEDGPPRWVRSMANVHRREDGAVVWDGVAFDITELKAAEAALRLSEATNRAIVEAAADGIITINEAGRIEGFNPAAERLFGYEATEVIGQDIRVLMPPAYRRGHDNRLRHYVDTGEATIIGRGAEVEGLRQDGTIFPMELSIGEARVDGRRIFAGIVRDITERKAAAETLRIGEERLRLALDAADLGTWDRDMVTGALSWSPRARTIFGVSADVEASYDLFFARVHPDDRLLVKQAMQAALDPVGDGHLTMECRLHGGGGAICWIAANGQVLFDGSGQSKRAIRFIGTVQDITDRKGSEIALTEALVEQESLLEQKETLLREVHHRVKNNLQVISSLLQLQRTEVQNQEARAHLSTASQRVYAMGRLHEQLYASHDLAKIEFGAYLRQLCQDVAELHARPEIEIEIETEPLTFDLEIAIPLGLIANELVSNSLKHAFPQLEAGHVRVMLRRGREQRIELTVADNGVGFTPEDQQPKGQLGMKLIRALTQQIDAEIRIDSEIGTQTTVCIPAGAASDKPTGDPIVPPDAD